MTPEETSHRTRARVKWFKLILALVGVLAVSTGFSILILRFAPHPNLAAEHVAWIVYLSILGITLLVNLSFVPLPIAVSIMIAASTHWNPVLIALSGSLGASLGEMSGYYAGLLGKKIAIPDNLSGYNMMCRWIQRWGIWAIAFLSFQPVLPIEIGGFIAGAARMPVLRFLPALWLGKFPKYLILIYAGLGVIHFLPFIYK